MGWIIYSLIFVSRSISAEICVSPALSFGSPIADIVPIARKLEESPSVTLDPSRLRAWDRNASLPCEPPFKATFRKGNKSLSFLAVRHIDEPVEPGASELAVLQKEIEADAPKAILIETVTGGAMPSHAINSIADHCYEGLKFSCGEAAYSALIARRVGAEVTGGEPMPHALNEALLTKMPRTDLLALLSTQTVLNLKRRGLPEAEWFKSFESELASSVTFPTGDWSFTKYKTWLDANLNTKSENISEEWLEPRADERANRMQKISSVVEQVREPLILKSAEQMLGKYDRAMIVYGAGHFYKQAPVFEHAFGKPKIDCLHP